MDAWGNSHFGATMPLKQNKLGKFSKSFARRIELTLNVLLVVLCIYIHIYVCLQTKFIIYETIAVQRCFRACNLHAFFFLSVAVERRTSVWEPQLSSMLTIKCRALQFSDLAPLSTRKYDTFVVFFCSTKESKSESLARLFLPPLPLFFCAALLIAEKKWFILLLIWFYENYTNKNDFIFIYISKFIFFFHRRFPIFSLQSSFIVFFFDFAWQILLLLPFLHAKKNTHPYRILVLVTYKFIVA